MKRLLYILLLYTFIPLSHGDIRPFETTRMMSQAGAGIGAILSIESAFLNPASIAFHTQSQIYYQRDQAAIEGNDDGTRTQAYGTLHREAYAIADVSTHLKGTMVYVNQSENGISSDQYTLSMSAAAGKNASVGIATTYGHDINPDRSNKYYTQSTIGYSYVLSEEISIGAIWVDTFNRSKKHHLLALGIQYMAFPKLMLLGDIGTNTRLDSSENIVSRYAVQVNPFGNFFLRSGQYHDNNKNLKGTSWGISWIGPKLDFHYAYKKSKQIKKSNLFLFSDEELVEQSYSLSFRF